MKYTSWEERERKGEGERERERERERESISIPIPGTVRKAAVVRSVDPAKFLNLAV